MFLDALKKIIKKQYNPLNIIEISKKKLISNFLYLSSIDTKIKIAASNKTMPANFQKKSGLKKLLLLFPLKSATI